MISSYRLPGESFDALCAGDADETGLAVLGAARLSKHLLLLRLVFDRLPAGTPYLRPPLELLADLHDHHRPAFDQVFNYPYVAAGLVSALRTLRAGHDPASVATFLAATALTVAIRAGRDAVLGGVPVIGPIHLPALGTAEAPRHDGVVRLATDGGRAMVGEVSVDLAAPEIVHPGWVGVRRLGAGPPFDDVDPYREIGGLSVASRAPDCDYAAWRDRYTGAMSLLGDRHPRRAAQVSAVLRVVTPLASLRPGQGRSASAWQAYGAVSATLPGDSLSCAVTLIHETQHSVLNGLLDLVDLYDRADQHLYYSPWRADPRPLRGLLHGCYAFLGVADFWARERGPRAEFELSRVVAQLSQALEILDAAASLTDDGRRLVARLTDRLATIGIDATADHLADLVSDDHRLSWRLRVLAPDPTIVHAAATAWRAGVDPPALPDAAELTAATETFVPNERIHRFTRLARQDSASAVDDYADEQLIGRNYQAAAKAFYDTIGAGIDDISVWTGLALAGSRLGGSGALTWRHRPELVRAVYQALAGPAAPPPHPLSLAGWLAGGLTG